METGRGSRETDFPRKPLPSYRNPVRRDHRGRVSSLRSEGFKLHTQPPTLDPAQRDQPPKHPALKTNREYPGGLQKHREWKTRSQWS